VAILMKVIASKKLVTGDGLILSVRDADDAASRAIRKAKRK